MFYIKEIDGLRGLAILSVVLFHLDVFFLKGGFLGVDVFFVISGYLITHVIMERMVTNDFSLMGFYQRRILRIFPVVFMMLIVTFIVSILVLLPHEIHELSQSLIASVFFLANHFFYLKVDYFNQFTNHSPLLHLWSLAVEEQFYLIYPIVLLMLNKQKFININYVLFIILIVSLIYAQFTVINDESFAFYSTLCRVWELLVGCLLAFNNNSINSYIKNSILFKKWVLELIGSVCLIIIILSFVSFTKNYNHPSISTLIPVLATSIVIMLIGKSKIISLILSNKLLIKLGILSFSIYVYHQPIILFLSRLNINKYNLSFKITSLVIIIALSHISYYKYEIVLRNLKTTRLKVFGTALIFIILLSSLGYITHLNKGFLEYYKKKYSKYSLVDLDTEKIKRDKFVNRAFQKNNFPPDNNNYNNIFIIGDSFGFDTYCSLFRVKKNFNLMYLNIDDTDMANLSYFINNNDNFLEYRTGGSEKKEMTKEYLENIEKSNIVIISAYWRNSTYKNGYILGNSILSKYNKKVYIMGSVIFQEINSLSIKLSQLDASSIEAKHYLYNNIRYDSVRTSDKLKKLVYYSKLNWIEKKDFFANDENKTCNLFDVSGRPLIFDYAHLTVRGYKLFGDYLLSIIEQD